MKQKLKADYKARSRSALLQEAAKLEKEIALGRMEIAMGKLKNTASIRRKKDDLAIVKTFITQQTAIK